MKKPNKKNLKHRMITKIASYFGQYNMGYCHRTHRTKIKKTGKSREPNPKKELLTKIKEEELWEDLRNKTNIIMS